MKKTRRNYGLRRLSVAAALAAAVGAPVSAQGPSAQGMTQYTSPAPAGMAERARRMMAEGNYAGAIDELRMLLRPSSAPGHAEEEECRFMLARALYERGEEGCVEALEDFTARYPASPHTPEARLLIGDHYFFAHEFGPAARVYSETDIDGLDPRSRALYTFRKGVSLTKAGERGKARSAFLRLRDDRGWRQQATFYLAYLDYLEGKYDKAYEGFQQAAGEGLEAAPHQARASRAASGVRRRGDYVPTGFEAGYYMAQIDFLRGRYAETIDHARSLMARTPVPELLPETDRIVGESYFKLGEPDVAKGYIDNYLEACRRDGSTPLRSAVYTLGAIHYGEGDYERSLEMMEGLTGTHDDIAQSAWLYTGQCRMRLGDATAAAMAFENAYGMGADRSVSETALYNYIAARTSGGRTPFSSAIPLLEEFLERYPRSRFAPALEERLATAYYHEKDYANAMASIERIANPSPQVLAAKQKVAYELGIERLANDDAPAAEKYMRIAASMGSRDADIARQARLWLGDALYAQRKYAQATRSYTEFLDGERAGSNRTLALYDLAYSLYMERRYADAARRFRQALDARPSLPAPLATDATIRLADCLYYRGDTQSAIDAYSRAIDAGATDADYALLRRAMTHGSAGDQKAKVADLRRLRQNHPQSKWAAQSLLEEGLAFSDMGDRHNAIKAFSLLAESYPQSAEARKGTLNLAIALQDAGDTDGADEAYRRLISRWPSSEEARMAGDDLRRIHASRGSLPELARWLAGVPGAPQLDTDEMERLAFDAAERALNDDAADTRRLEAYVRDYPDGQYIAQALLDLAETRLEKGDARHALEAAEELLSRRPDSRQAPAALTLKAGILEKGRPARKAEALKAWRALLESGGADYSLDAYAGIMRTTPDPEEAIAYARRLRGSGGLSVELAEEASLHEALALLALKRTREARAILRSLAKNPASEAGARAAVELGESLLRSGETKEAENVLSDFTDEGSPHHYWLARGFIALADVCHAQGKTRLAREYLSSLSQNYPGAEREISEMIDSRLKNWKK